MSAEREGRATDAKAVDIYELYWADLAKKTGGIAQILAKFYQLLFHLSFLGVKTVEWAWAQQTDVRVKRRLRNVLTTQAVVDALLGGVTPVLNIVLAAMILPVLALRFPGERWVLALSLIAGAIAAGAGYYAARNKVNRARASPESSSSPALLLVPLVLAVVVALGIYLGLAEVSDPYRYALAGLYVLAQVACVALVVWITAKLADRRAASPFSAAGGTDARSWLNSVPRASLLPTLAAGAGFWWAGWHYQTAADGSLSSQLLLTVTHAAEAFLMLVNACWIVLMIAAAAMCVAGWWCLRIVPAADKATRRAIWTGKMGFLVSASLFSLVTLIAWAALVHVLKPAIPADVVYVEWVPVFGGCADATLLCKIALLNDTVGGAGYNVFLVVLFLAAAALVIAFLPSVLLESAPVLDRNANRSAALGHWLDLGLASLRIVGYALLTSLIVVVPALGVAAAFHLGFFARDYDLHGIWSSSLVAYAAGALIAPLALMVSIRTNLFGGFQRAVNIALDVDNWLSERPAENNPRGPHTVALSRIVAAHRGPGLPGRRIRHAQPGDCYYRRLAEIPAGRAHRRDTGLCRLDQALIDCGLSVAPTLQSAFPTLVWMVSRRGQWRRRRAITVTTAVTISHCDGRRALVQCLSQRRLRGSLFMVARTR